MSVDAKTRLLDMLKTILSDKLTLTDIDNALNSFATELLPYDVTLILNQTYDSDNLVQDFLNALLVEGRSAKTLNRYKYILGRFFKYIKVPSQKVSVFNIREYIAHEKHRGLSDTSLEGMRQIFSSYFGWLYKEGVILRNPVANIGAIKIPKKIKDLFSDVDIELLKKACKTTRDSAIITFLLSTGCRVSEVVALNRNDVDLINLECIVFGKGSKERLVYLDSVAGMFLSKYLKERTDDNEALFLSRNKERLNAGGIRKMLKTLEERTEVTNVHPHKFRRTLATNLIKHGMPIEQVSKILGHEKIETTMEYVILDDTDIEYSYRKHA